MEGRTTYKKKRPCTYMIDEPTREKISQKEKTKNDGEGKKGRREPESSYKKRNRTFRRRELARNVWSRERSGPSPNIDLVASFSQQSSRKGHPAVNDIFRRNILAREKISTGE